MTTETLASAAVPTETVTPIKPSEALRLGRLLEPRRASGNAFSDAGACALGAIHLGWGGDRNDDIDTRYDLTMAPLWAMLGTDCSPARVIGQEIFDEAEHDGRDGDAAVLAYLESRGL